MKNSVRNIQGALSSFENSNADFLKKNCWRWKGKKKRSEEFAAFLDLKCMSITPNVRDLTGLQYLSINCVDKDQIY